MSPVSLDQFRAQIQQTPNMDAKVKMDGADGLKTYGTGFMGKLACWFQKSAERKSQSQEVRQSFIDSLRREFGNSAAVDNVVTGLGGNTRLSLRNIRQAIQQLDTHTHTNRMNDVFTDLGEKMGFDPPRTTDGKLDMARLGDLSREITRDIEAMRNRGGITEEQAKNITRDKIENYILQNKTISSPEDGFKILSQIASTKGAEATTKVFDSLISKEGGLNMLKECSLRLLDQECADCNPSTYLRGNSTAIKLTTKVLEHLMATANTELMESIKSGLPETIPDKKTEKTEYQQTTLSLAQSALDKIVDTWAESVDGDTRTFLSQIHGTASRYEANIGTDPGYKTTCNFIGLRVLNPMIITEAAKMNSSAKQSLMIDIGKGIQILANVTAGGDAEGLIHKLSDSSRFLGEFIATPKNQTDFTNMVATLSVAPTRD